MSPSFVHVQLASVLDEAAVELTRPAHHLLPPPSHQQLVQEQGVGEDTKVPIWYRYELVTHEPLNWLRGRER